MMPEAFSAPLIDNYIQEYHIQPAQTILDPFSGTGTTILAAKLQGIHGVGIEVNPFLCFASRMKLKWDYHVPGLRKQAEHLKQKISASLTNDPLDYTPLKPNMPRLDKWMTPRITNKVLCIKQFIAEIPTEEHQQFFLLALASILREVSNMKLSPHAFGSCEHKGDAPVFELFHLKSSQMISDVTAIQSQNNHWGKTDVIQGDNRMVDVSQHDLLPADLAITSPPYLNNLDYTMQTRMELFFLDFVHDMTDLRTIRKGMVTCDAKAMYKDIKDHELVSNIASIQKIIQKLKEVHKGKNWGWDYPFMAAQYFGGMLKMLINVNTMLKPGARYVIVTGESSHSGVLVPVPDITAELGHLAGFDIDEIVTHRIRRSSSHTHGLRECSVILKRL